MNALKSPTDEPALRGLPIAYDQAPVLLSHVMGFVAVTVELPRSAPTSAEI
jgi:hypothetical protein